MPTIHFEGGLLNGQKRRVEVYYPYFQAEENIEGGFKYTKYNLTKKKAKNGKMMLVYVAVSTRVRLHLREP